MYFSAVYDGREYRLNLPLAHKIGSVQHAATGQEIRFCIQKAEPKLWTKLTAGREKYRYVQYDIERMAKQTEEEKRPFLKIDDDGEENSDDIFVDECGSDSERDSYNESDYEDYGYDYTPQMKR